MEVEVVSCTYNSHQLFQCIDGFALRNLSVRQAKNRLQQV
jgi:hypothetical protein